MSDVRRAVVVDRVYCDCVWRDLSSSRRKVGMLASLGRLDLLQINRFFDDFFRVFFRNQLYLAIIGSSVIILHNMIDSSVFLSIDPDLSFSKI